MRVAVLGSNSFIGSDLIDLLTSDSRNDVVGTSRSPEKSPEYLAYAVRRPSNFKFVRADVNSESAELLRTLDDFEPTWIVNLSAQGDDAASWLYPADFLRTNCVALARLVDALKDRPYLRKFLHVSSSSVYRSSSALIQEDAPIGPASPYGVSKAAADLLLLAYASGFGFPVSIVRPPNVYGPHQSPFRIIPKTILAVKRGTRVELHGGGLAVRQYLHVRDLSRAILMLLEAGNGGDVYNVAPATTVRVRDIVAVACESLGADFDRATLVVEDRRAQQSGQTLGAEKIEREVGWVPAIDIRAGVETVVAWIERDYATLARSEVAYVHRP